MASNQKNNNSSSELSTPEIQTPVLNVPPPQLNLANLSRRLGTLKRKVTNQPNTSTTLNAHNLPNVSSPLGKKSKPINSPAKQEYNEYKATKDPLKRYGLTKKFIVEHMQDKNGRHVVITTHKSTGEEVNREYRGGKRRIYKRHTRRKGHSKRRIHA